MTEQTPAVPGSALLSNAWQHSLISVKWDMFRFLKVTYKHETERDFESEQKYNGGYSNTT